MSHGNEAKSYRSPQRKLVRFFEKSRDGWKRKCLAAKTKAKALANNVTALRKSRARWKGLARELRSEVERLQEELEQAKSSPR